MTNDFETLISGQQFKKIYEKKYNRITEKYGLHKIEIEILLFLESTDYDKARDIAEIRFFSKAHISKATENLIRRGYLSGIDDEGDRRIVHLELTEASRPILSEIKKLRTNLSETLFSGVTAEEKKTMLTVAKKIVGNINNELH
ncbi:winged helix DNA-binding protein [Acetobacterium paludosum]|uniref:Winged helix DNA-binding protein n=1 Tax=Acetobacterium paludosum TaxID=52693 RepID=A0A923HXM2_9FIRM|nr:MarR family winged helix-turn-helix transcriptional regulator [Acetobacterium paludosum]MBC3889045.1 winged helix DNA-binding protein [Acetobacterium paludosum]